MPLYPFRLEVQRIGEQKSVPAFKDRESMIAHWKRLKKDDFSGDIEPLHFHNGLWMVDDIALLEMTKESFLEQQTALRQAGEFLLELAKLASKIEEDDKAQLDHFVREVYALCDIEIVPSEEELEGMRLAEEARAKALLSSGNGHKWITAYLPEEEC